MASGLLNISLRIIVSCLLLSAAAQAGSLPREDGPVGFGPESFPEQQAWQEGALELPAWPQESRLIRLDVNTGGAPFETFIDPASIAVGDDGVVRFTSVQVSSSGVWNVTYEGLHCGEKNYRRFAYGARERWHALPDSGWESLDSSGTGRYRYVLYHFFMCNPGEARKDAGRIVQALRYPPRRIQD
jgi:hypothetical protein